MRIEVKIQNEEAAIEGLKPDNEARIIWAGEKNQKTRLAFVYLHGFGASQREGQPIMGLISRKFQANVYLSRLKGHGIYREDTFKELTKENFLESAEDALSIGRKLGEKVILISTSTGGMFSLMLAAKNHDLAGIILYSPFIDLKDPALNGIIEPGGIDKFVVRNGGEMLTKKRPSEEAKYWSTNYHVNGYYALISLLKANMKATTFSKVKCPVFMGYYYKNEEEQDPVVSVSAMLEMFDQLGTDNNRKEKIAFPESGNHVIGCDLRSSDWKRVYSETVKFIENIILNE